MRRISVITILVCFAPGCTRGPIADDTANALDSCDKSGLALIEKFKHVEAMMADPHFREQVKSVMNNRTYQEQAKRIITRMEALDADPKIQEQAYLYAEQIEELAHRLDRSVEEQATHIAEQMQAVSTRASADHLVDGVVDKIFDRAVRKFGFGGGDLENTVHAKPSHSGSPSLQVGRSAFARATRPTVAHIRASRNFRESAPVEKVNRRPADPFWSASGPVKADLPSKSANEFDPLKLRPSRPEPWKKSVEELTPRVILAALALGIALHPDEALAEAAKVADKFSRFKQVDKTGFIGGISSYLEIGLEKIHDSLIQVGVTKNTYGLSIAIFTVLVRTVALPLTRIQIESSVRVQELQPYREKINQAFPEKSQEQVKSQMIGTLFKEANVNPLAGCFPAIIQIPVFISLYRTLSNLCAEGKLTEGFLWLPSLEGPIYGGRTAEWFSSFAFGTPILGWEDTFRYLTLPALLVIAQSGSQKLLAPPTSPDAVMTQQEKTNKQVLGFLPFMIAYFSTNVPSGLSIYWITSNLVTTGLTVGLKKTIQKKGLPPEAQEVVDSIEEKLEKMKNIVWAAKTGNFEILQDLLAKGADVNEKDEEGRSALHFAAGSPAESVPAAEALIKAGAQVDMLDGGGNSPLHYAAGYGRASLTKILLEKGAAVTVNNAGQSPADVARLNGNEKETPVSRDEALLAKLEVSSDLRLRDAIAKAAMQITTPLPLLSDDALAVGDTAQIFGMKRLTQYEGKQGKVIGFDDTSGRVLIEVADEPQPLRIVKSNLKKVTHAPEAATAEAKASVTASG